MELAILPAPFFYECLTKVGKHIFYSHADNNDVMERRDHNG